MRNVNLEYEKTTRFIFFSKFWSCSKAFKVLVFSYSLSTEVLGDLFKGKKILLAFQKNQDLDSFVISKHFFLIPIVLSANTSEFYF